MKHKILLLLLSVCLLATTRLCSQVIITGPMAANTNDIQVFTADLSYDPCHYGYIDLGWVITGGTIISQDVSGPNYYCEVQWTAVPGDPASIELWGDHAPAPPGYPTYCFTGTPELLASLNIMMGNVFIAPLSQYVQWPGANATPICVSMPGVTINSYQWRSRANSFDPWVNMAGETSSCLQVNSVSMPMYYSCQLQTSSGTFVSSPAFVSFKEYTSGSIEPSTPTPAYNQSVTIYQTPATGGFCMGNYQYSWEVSIENGPWVVMGTSENYPSSAITIVGNTRMRRKAVCGTLGDVTLYTNIISINPTYTSVDYENRNYIREITVQKKGVNSWYEADVLSIGDKFQKTTYLDGLGRPIQTVVKGVSASSPGVWKDIVQHHEYDEADRVTKQYLNYATANNPGKFKTNAATAQPAYISAFFGEPANEPTYSVVEYDNSPLNITKKAMPSGASWAGDNIGVSAIIEFNKADEKVHIWTLAYSPSALPTTSPTSVYPTGSLEKRTMIDEDGSKTIYYNDLEGRLILKKTQKVNSGLLSIEHAGWVSIYYVHNDMGQLRYIITPKAVKYLDENGWSFTQAIADDFCYRYQYDKKGRKISEKQPESGEKKIIYDKKDRVVLLQHANQDKANNSLLTKNQWAFILYDDLDRVVVEGLLDNDGTRDALQDNVNLLANGLVTVSAFVGNGNESVKTDNPVAGSSGSSNYLTGTSNIIYNSITYYDNYNYPSVKAFNTTYTLAYTSTPGIEPIVKTDRTTGMVTGQRTRVLTIGNNTFLFSTIYYDEKGRPLEMLVDNIKMNNGSGVDYKVNQYHFSGRLMSSYNNHKPDPSTAYTNILKNEYDLIGRPIRQSRNFNNSFYKQLADYTYDELGHLKTKRLAPGYTSNGGNEIETLDYDYNIRGWLTGINKNYALSDNNYTQWDRYFSMYVGYDDRDNRFAGNQFNGQISGIIWRSQGDNTPRKFDFSYDITNRFTSALFNQRKKPSDGSWSNSSVDLSTEVEYEDDNGNIKKMKHMGVIPGVVNGVIVDDLTYSYLPSGVSGLAGNRLEKVGDNSSLGTSNGLLGDFKDPNTTQDYYYDVNGNLVKDLNKNIKNGSGNGVIYNYLNKPEKIIIEGKSTIEFTYDAGGVKLKKKVTYANNSVRTTTYISPYVYEEFVPAGQAGAGDLLMFVLHEEGRLKIITPHAKNPANGIDYDLNAGSFGITNWPGGKHAVFEYFVKDHLGSTRMVLTEEVQKEYYLATMENNVAGIEEPYFGQVDANGAATAANELRKTRLGFTTPPSVWPGNNTDVAKLTATNSGKVLGPNMVLKVMAGDVINTNVQYYFAANNSSGSGNLLNSIGSSFVNALSGAQSTLLGKNQSTAISTSLTTNTDFTTFLGQHSIPGSAPKAHLNIVFVDEQFKFIEEDPVTGNVGTKSSRVLESSVNDPLATLVLNQKAPKNGWVFIFLSNESDESVYFDNLQIRHDHSAIAQESHFYPFGQKIAGISSKAIYKLENRYSYQGNYSEEEEETGWNEFALRMYDPQIGRWIGNDPYHIYASPYIGMGNDPILKFDPNGGDPDPVDPGPGAYIRIGNIIYLDPKVHDPSDYFDRYDGKTGYSWVGPELSKELLEQVDRGDVRIFKGSTSYGGVDYYEHTPVEVVGTYAKCWTQPAPSTPSDNTKWVTLDKFKATKWQHNDDDNVGEKFLKMSGNTLVSGYNSLVGGTEAVLNPHVTIPNVIQAGGDAIDYLFNTGASQMMDDLGTTVSSPDFVEDFSAGLLLTGGTKVVGGSGAGRLSAGSSAAGAAAGTDALHLYKINSAEAAVAQQAGRRMLSFADQGSLYKNLVVNYRLLLQEMRASNIIYDTFRHANGALKETTGFLMHERNFLLQHGWTYNPSMGAWIRPY